MAVADSSLPALQETPPGLYRHYKGGWYEVINTVRCSETLQGMTLYRALYGAGLASGVLWVRPAAMFNESGEFAGKLQPRFAPRDPENVQLADLPTAHAIVAHLRGLADRRGLPPLDTALRPPPPEPCACCGRGCNGCVWEGFYAALQHWRTDALAFLQPNEVPSPAC